MSTEQIVKIKVCALRVGIHCDGCQKKVKKVLQKIEGVYKVSIDSEQGKVTVSGDFDPEILIKKLKKHGKRAELWDDAPKPNTNGEQTQQPIVKNMQLDNGKEGKKDSGSGPNGEHIQQQQPQRGGQQQIPSQQRMLQAPTQQQMQAPNQQQMEPPAQQQIQRTPNQQPQQLRAVQLQNPNQQQQQQVSSQQQQLQGLSQQQTQQLQQLQGVQQQVSNQQQREQQMRGLQDMKMPGPNPNQQAARVNGPRGDEISEDDSDEYEEEEDESDDDVLPLIPRQSNKIKPVMGNVQGGGQMPPSLRMNPGMSVGQQLPPQMMRAGPPGNGAPNGGNGASIGANGAANAKEGGSGGGNIPVAVNAGSNSHNGLGGKTGGGNQIPGASGAGNIPLQMNAGGKKEDGANGDAGTNQNAGSGGRPANGSGGGPNKNASGGGGGGSGVGGGNAGNEQRKVVINDEVHVMPNMTGMSGGAGGLAGRMGNFRPTGPMGPMRMGPAAAIQGVPATAPGGNYFAAAGPEAMQLNPYHQQQHQMALMMNQQRDDNARFQPMVYAQAPPELNSMPPYPYHQMPQQLGPYNNYFSEENPTSCSIM